MWLMKILKVTENKSLEDTFLENHKLGGIQIDPSAFLGLIEQRI